MKSLWDLLRTDKNRLVGPVNIPVAALCVAAAGVLARAKPALVIAPDASKAEAFSSCLDSWWKFFGENNDGLYLPDGIGTEDRISAESDSPRTFALSRTMRNPARVTVASIAALLSPTPSPQNFKSSEIILRVGETLSMTDLVDKLIKMDYDTVDEIAVPGEFVRRGGVMDIFSFSAAMPARIEYFGDEIDTIRLFDPTTQKSVEKVEEYRLVLRSGITTCGDEEHDFTDYVPAEKFQVFYLHPELIATHAGNYLTAKQQKRYQLMLKKYAASAVSLFDAVESAQHIDAFQPSFFPVEGLIRAGIKEDGEGAVSSELLRQWNSSILNRWRKEGVSTLILGHTERDLQQINEFLVSEKLCQDKDNSVQTGTGTIPCGMFFPKLQLALLTERELFGYTPKTPARKLTESFEPVIAGIRRDMTNINDYSAYCDLEEDDYAVHLQYGLCIYRGLKTVKTSDAVAEMILLEFDGGKILSVPLWQAHCITRYVGARNNNFQLSKLSTSKWERTKMDAENSVRSMAYGMLQMQAVRCAVHSDPCPPDALDQRMFEDSFQFHETPDQLTAAAEIKADMESERPMDRLLCGDVGFGKTELAMRAAFKAVVAGRQVAVLAPTTVLAQQHYYTFTERFREFPISIQQLSRFRSKTEQRDILKELSEGRCDIVIGTHRLVQEDVKFKNLGLIVIDEEQRFGVKQKERLKKLRVSADVLAMTATPIPRTLYMSMSGIRDLSTLMSAPVQRLPVRTIVAVKTTDVITAAITRETGRGGQVFYLYNRVQSIDSEAEKLRDLFPNLHIAVAHGQMDETELETVMSRFIEGTVDVLVCTTIIESGLDIPNANTIIINRADCLGLAELYQLRGRVGRWTRQAYAYMLIPDPSIMTSVARQRIDAIRTYTHLGAGFKLAMRDLEIRGAGNILGAEQSGQINAIGFHLYCSLLRACVAQIHGDKIVPPPEVDLFLNFLVFASSSLKDRVCACFDDKFINSERFRLEIYRRIATAVSESDLDSLESEVRDRFGSLPENARNMFTCARIRVLAAQHGIESITAGDDNKIYMQRKDGSFVKPNGFVPRYKPVTRPRERLAALLKLLQMPDTFVKK